METGFPIKRTRKAKTPLLKLASRLGLAIVAVALITLKGALAQAVSSGASPAATQSPIVGGRIDIWTDGLDNYWPAVAYNSNHDEYLVVWQTEQDAYTYDIWARRVDSDGTLLSSFNVATAPGEKREYPAVAYDAVRDEYLVVYAHSCTDYPTSDVFAKRVAWDGSWMSSEIAVAQAPGWHFQPTVAYNSIDDEYLVVYVNAWEDDLVDIYAQRVRGSDGALQSWSAVASGAEADREFPSVAYSAAANGGSGGYLIAYDYYHFATSAQEIRAKVGQADLGDLRTNPEITLCTSGNYQVAPAVASGWEGYLAIWWEDRPGGLQVRGRRVGSDGTPLGSGDGFGISEENTLFVSDLRTALAYGEGYGYLATWLRYNTGSSTHDIAGRYVMDGQDSASGSPFVIEGSGSVSPSVACAPSGDCLVGYRWWIVGDYDIGGRFVRPHRVYLPLVLRNAQ
jgi:hypothetical protein